jgi:2-phosphosulfolactate phosphatase
VTGVFGQDGYAVRFDWGQAGARACAAAVDVVVDVLSFSTAVTVATERGTRVHPCAWRDERAAAAAAGLGAVLAVGRADARRDGAASAPSLSPAALRHADLPERLVLPSPNGSTIAAALAAGGGTVVAGCLRNATSVGVWLAGAVRAGRTVAVIAAGERWREDGSLRPALEDHLGAGAILSAVRRTGPVRLSPEAEAAAALYDAVAGDLARLLEDAVGGRELGDAGFADDVAVAAEVDASPVVPVLVDGAFTRIDDA